MSAPTAGRWDDLLTRIGSAFVIAVLGFGTVWLGGVFFLTFCAAVAALIVWEISRMLGAQPYAMPFAVLSAASVLFVSLMTAPWAIGAIFLVPLVGLLRLEQQRVLFALFSLFAILAAYGLTFIRETYGLRWVFWLLLVVVTSDILGYFAGRFLGGPKFWPKISPKKTWSGTIAGWGGAAVIGLVFSTQTQSAWPLIVLSVAVALAGQMGDIAESAMKRKVGVKDSSNLIPGHGGVFDRFDAMIGAAAFVVLVQFVLDFPPGLN